MLAFVSDPAVRLILNFQASCVCRVVRASAVCDKAGYVKNVCTWLSCILLVCAFTLTACTPPLYVTSQPVMTPNGVDFSFPFCM